MKFKVLPDLAPSTPIHDSQPTHCPHMIRNRRSRRVVAVLLMAAGGVLMLLSTEVGAGLLVFGLGVLLEVVGLALEHRDRQ